jgi:4'-phosphopantetheinyl transferase
VVCALGHGIRVGVDIEQVKPVDFADFHDLMNEEQWILIKKATDPLKEFFKHWAIKESIIKADGRGLNIPLNDIMISGDIAYYENRWYLNELKIDEGYCAWLSSNQKAVVHAERVEFNLLRS